MSNHTSKLFKVAARFRSLAQEAPKMHELTQSEAAVLVHEVMSNHPDCTLASFKYFAPEHKLELHVSGSGLNAINEDAKKALTQKGCFIRNPFDSKSVGYTVETMSA